MSEVTGNQAPWTVGRLLDWTIQFFRDRQIEGGRLSAELLLARAMGCRKIDLYTRYEVEPTEEQRATFRDLVKQAGQHAPIAYLLGTREFFSLDFEVSPAVLVPRPETEALVQRAVAICRSEPERTWNVLDIGTGSGCIAVSLARYASNARVVASDVSTDALAVASANVARHGMGERVRLVEGDCAAIPADALPESRFDLIVSNPPYISDAVWENLTPNVRDHEPKLALTGAGGDGLGMYRRLAAETPGVLGVGGRLLVEIGYDQFAAVREIFEQAGGWIFVGSHRDRIDPHERVLEFGR